MSIRMLSSGLLVLTLCGSSGMAQGIQFVDNGGFETGDFTGWTVTDIGAPAWVINNGSLQPISGVNPLPPISGSFDAMTDQAGPGTHRLSQTFVVPPVVNMATLTWSDRIQNLAMTFSDPNQEFRVLVLDQAGAVLTEVFSTNPMDPLIQIGPNNRSYDLTTLLQGLANQQVTLAFEEQDNLFYLNVTIDDVSLIIDTPNQPSRFLKVGVGCPRSEMLYELFAPGTVDISNTAFTFTPGGSNVYVVSQGGTFETSLTNSVPSGDDDVLGPFNLGFTFPYGGGAGITTAIEVSSNGYVYLRPGTIGNSRCCNGSPSVFAQEAESIAVFGQDLNPAAGGQIFVDTFTNPNRLVVTWNAVPEFGSGSPSTAQCQLFDTGQIVLAYQTVALATHTAIVGYSPGNGADDNGPVDLTTALPVVFGVGGSPLRLDAFLGDRPVLGGTFDLQITDIPSGTSLAFLVLGFRQTSIDLTSIGMPGCTQLTSGESNRTFVPGPAGAGCGANGCVLGIGIPSTMTLAGFNATAQAAAFVPGANPLGVALSNAGVITVGDY